MTEQETISSIFNYLNSVRDDLINIHKTKSPHKLKNTITDVNAIINMIRDKFEFS